MKQRHRHQLNKLSAGKKSKRLSEIEKLISQLMKQLDKIDKEILDLSQAHSLENYQQIEKLSEKRTEIKCGIDNFEAEWYDLQD